MALSLRAGRRACRVPEVLAGARLQALRDQAAAPVVDLHWLRAPCPSDCRDDLPQVLDFAAPLVLRDVSDDEHSLRDLRKQLERELGVSYKTAWRMFNKIRNELMADDEASQLSGDVEVDETSWGGQASRRS